MTVLPYGTWPSPISPAALAGSGRRLGDLGLIDGDLAWIEGRPTEAGRSVLCRRRPDGTVEEMTPTDWSVRTTVHEYGGASWAPSPLGPLVSRFDDQRLWLLRADGEPVALTPEPDPPMALRYADVCADPSGTYAVAVRETHSEGSHEPVNDLVRVELDGSGVTEIASGHDFFAAPRISPDGTRLAWVSWDHPCMPWDGTELHVAPIGAAGQLESGVVVAGGPTEAAQQPRWTGAGLLYVTDPDGWWNLHLDGEIVSADQNEWGIPPWVFGTRTFDALPDGQIAAVWWSGGLAHLGTLSPTANTAVTEIDLPYTFIDDVTALPDGRIAAIVAGPAHPLAVVVIGTDGSVEEIVSSMDEAPDPAYISEPEVIEFPTAGDATAYGVYFPPQNADVSAPDDEKPPLIVLCHGGPTAAAFAIWSAKVAFWTTRGFGVVDVNYRGSTGFGTEYRRALDGQWGIADIDDCVAAAEFLAAEGKVDGHRLIIRGGSAGGYTVLGALTFRDTFACGASLYGIGDLEILARDTHKFEARYLDRMVGPYPAAAEVYRARSPINHTDQLNTPMIVLQGADDKVVPPNQAEAIVAALKERGITHEYLLFEGEGHGFRRADTIERAAEAELAFYRSVLDLG